MAKILNKGKEMLRAGFLFALLLLFCADIFSPAAIVLRFYLERDRIAKELCVKKAEPDNCCQGSCQLEKALEEDSNQHQEKNATEIKRPVLVLFCLVSTDSLVPHHRVLIDHTPREYSRDRILAGFPFEVFRPPSEALLS
jgi:hypothetical protein